MPAAPPADAVAVGNSSTSCRITWGNVPLKFQNGLILGYNITYLKVGDSDTAMKYIVVNGNDANNTGIPGLLKFTTYTITVAAFTNKGRGNGSTYANTTCQTLEDGTLL